MTMAAKHCEELLLDLAYGELSSTVEAEARAHLAVCPQCAAVLKRIEGGLQLARRLPLEDPPASLSHRLMEAARASAHASTENAVRTETRPSVAPWHAVAEWLRRFPMVRQVQMAIVMLLIVGVGLWSVPQMTRKLRAPGQTVVSPDHDGEAAPSAALAPAKPLDLAVDPYTRRIRAKGERNASARVAREVKEPAVPSDMAASEKRKEGADLAAAEPSGDAREALAEPAATAQAEGEAAPEAPAAAPAEEAAAPVEADKAVAAKDAPALDELAAGPAKKERAFAPPPPSAAVASAEKSVAAAKRAPPSAKSAAYGGGGQDDPMVNPYASGNEAASSRLAARAAGSLGKVSVGAAQPATAPDGTGSVSALYARALERYRAGDYSSARSLLEALLARSDLGKERSSALLYQARSLRALGRCDLAVAPYAALASRYLGTAEAAAAVREGAACYEVLGQSDKAAALLQRDKTKAKPTAAAAPAERK